MFNVRSLLSSLLLLVAASSALPAWSKDAASYRFDGVHSQVLFFVSHLGFSHGVGRVRLGPGSFRFDADEWSVADVDVVIELNTLDMGDAKWTETVLSKQFLDVEKYPQARFVSQSVEKTSANQGVVRGELTLRGKSQPLDLQITFNKAGRDPYSFKDKVGFSATARLQRGDFDIDRYQGVVGEEVEFRIEIEGIRDRKADTTPTTSGASDGS